MEVWTSFLCHRFKEDFEIDVERAWNDVLIDKKEDEVWGDIVSSCLVIDEFDFEIDKSNT